MYDYQKKVVEHIMSHPGAGVFLGMGLGKTLITLTAILKLMYEDFEISNVLVIAPKKVAEATWQDEAEKWNMPFTFSAILGTAAERRRAINKRADIYLVNRENVLWLMKELKWQPNFDMLVIDESTSFKDQSTKRWKALKRVRGSFKRVVLLTGTPAPNSLMDLWAQVYLLDGGKRLGRTITEYRNNYFVPGMRNGAVIYNYKIRNKEAEQEIYNRISDICISLKSEDYRNMPDVLPPVVLPVVLDDHAKEVYKEMLREQVAELNGKEITATSAAAVSNKLLQIANGAIYDNDGRVVEVHDAKIQALSEIEERPLLVFYNFKHDLARLLKAFPEARKLETAQDIKDWNAGKIPMLLAHPASAGYGLNLQQGGHIVVWFGLTWSLEQYQQANARLARQGQTEPVTIIHLVAKGTIDEKVMAALKHKRSGQDAMMEAIKMLAGSVNEA